MVKITMMIALVLGATACLASPLASFWHQPALPLTTSLLYCIDFNQLFYNIKL